MVMIISKANKIYLSITALLLLAPFFLFPQDRTSEFLIIIRDIINYTTPGYQDITENGQFTYRLPFSILEYNQGYFAIQPNDVFIKCYNKNTNEIYYTRNTSLRIIEGHLYLSNNFVLNNINFPKANRYKLIDRDNRYYIQLQYRDMIIPQYIDDLTELETIHEFELKFYRPTGNIIQNINNLYFKFESTEEVTGYVERDILYLSNIDIMSEIQKLCIIVNSIEQNEIREKYLKKVNYLKSFFDKNFHYSLYFPHIVISTISQFYDVEIIESLRD